MFASLKIVHGLIALLAFQQAPNPTFNSQLASDPSPYVQTVEARAAWGAVETADEIPNVTGQWGTASASNSATVMVMQVSRPQ
jgi:hypothetical protein